MQNESSTVVITAGVSRELRDDLAAVAKATYHSTAAEIRRALAAHVGRERARTKVLAGELAKQR